MFKNQTPQQLSFFIAGISAAAMAALLLILKAFTFLNVTWPEVLGLFVLAFAVAFVANYYLVRYFIFRRIKLIYKIIHRQKLPSEFRAGNLDMTKNVLDDVEREVGEWAAKQESELEELERLATYRRRFIGDVSHELKTPIFNVQGFIHTLLDGALYDSNVNLQYLQRAAKNIERLQMIVEDLETINKLEAGQMILDLQEFDLHDLTDEVYADLEMRAHERNIRLTYKEGANQRFRIRADKESIRQVLMNLVHNSIKYGKEGGLTKISFYDMETYVLVEISDNGIGITPEHLSHVFDRFYRVDKHRSREAGGTGLGLSIVKHIIEAHKQTINVRSSVGQGSTFGFTLEKA
ncbi:MAG TPA: ATP-binding protein [Saprospiraceae bacterium]|nr:sensor histidine kinase [Saprospiraceae bacterium]HLP95348.1 ATP-binding protein [Saprospiraceae bacterium]